MTDKRYAHTDTHPIPIRHNPASSSIAPPAPAASAPLPQSIATNLRAHHLHQEIDADELGQLAEISRHSPPHHHHHQRLQRQRSSPKSSSAASSAFSWGTAAVSTGISPEISEASPIIAKNHVAQAVADEEEELRKPLISAEDAVQKSSVLQPIATESEAPAYEDEEGAEEEVEEEGEEDEFVVTATMKITVVACSLLMLVITLPATLIYPFLPDEAVRHGSSETTVGFVFSSYSFAVLIAAFFGGKVASKISAERMILYGGFINAVSTTVFSFALGFEGTSFVTFCMAMRFCQGIGASFVELGINVLVTYQFQDNPAIALCWVDLCSGLACVFGPTLGGLMYDFGGFKLPFLVVGISTAAMIAGLVFVLPEKDVQDQEHTEEVGMKQVLSIPIVPVLLFLCITSLMTSGFLDATLETHLNAFGLRPSVIGVIISMLGLSYSVAAPLVAWLLGRVSNVTCFVAGAAMAVLGLLLLGPAPFLPIETNVTYAVIGVLLVGFGTSFIGTPILPSVLEETRHLGEPAREIIVGTAICAYSIGDILGPVLGTSLLGYFSFQFATIVVALSITIALAIQVLGSVLHQKAAYSIVIEAESANLQNLIEADDGDI